MRSFYADFFNCNHNQVKFHDELTPEQIKAILNKWSDVDYQRFVYCIIGDDIQRRPLLPN